MNSAIIVLTLGLAFALTLVAVFAVHCVRLEERHHADERRLAAWQEYASKAMLGAHFWQGQFRSSQEQVLHHRLPDEITPADYLVERGDAYALMPAISSATIPLRSFCLVVAKRGPIVTRVLVQGPGSGVAVEMLEAAYMGAMNRTWLELVCDADERRRQTPGLVSSDE